LGPLLLSPLNPPFLLGRLNIEEDHFNLGQKLTQPPPIETTVGKRMTNPKED